MTCPHTDSPGIPPGPSAAAAGHQLRAAAAAVTTAAVPREALAPALAAAARDLCIALRGLASAGPPQSMPATVRRHIQAASVSAGGAWAELAAALAAWPGPGSPDGPPAALAAAARQAAAAFRLPATGDGGHGDVLDSAVAAAGSMAAAAGYLAAGAPARHAARCRSAQRHLETAAAQLTRARDALPGRPRPPDSPGTGPGAAGHSRCQAPGRGRLARLIGGLAPGSPRRPCKLPPLPLSPDTRAMCLSRMPHRNGTPGGALAAATSRFFPCAPCSPASP
jgi:hypothetical protein